MNTSRMFKDINPHANKASSWMLFRKADGGDSAIDFFNQDLSELSFAEIFKTKQDCMNHLGKKGCIGMPFVLEVKLDNQELEEKLTNGKFEEIAKSVVKMDSKWVEFKDGKFSSIERKPSQKT